MLGNLAYRGFVRAEKLLIRARMRLFRERERALFEATRAAFLSLCPADAAMIRAEVQKALAAQRGSA